MMTKVLGDMSAKEQEAYAKAGAVGFMLRQQLGLVLWKLMELHFGMQRKKIKC